MRQLTAILLCLILVSACDQHAVTEEGPTPEPVTIEVHHQRAEADGIQWDPRCGRSLTITQDTTVTDTLMLRAGDTLRFENHARLMFADGGVADWQGTPTDTWSWDGEDPATITTNLSRDVVVEGQGDIMFHEGSGASVIRYVEIDLQPLEEVDHYPLHWHFAGDGSRGTLVEGVVVKNSTNRAYVPHGSHGITFVDNIATNIAGAALWWNAPPSRYDGSNNSNDTVVDRMLVRDVTNLPGDDRGFTLSAYVLGAGTGNRLTNSVAQGIHPSHVKNCSGFLWPSGSAQQPWVWHTEGLATFESDCFGVFWWQNNGQEHVASGLDMPDGILHGAYGNNVEYRNVTTTLIHLYAVGWSMHDSDVGSIVTREHRFEGDVHFYNTDVDRLVLDGYREWRSDVKHKPAHLYFETTSLTCADIETPSMIPGTTVTIDGQQCTL